MCFLFLWWVLSLVLYFDVIFDILAEDSMANFLALLKKVNFFFVCLVAGK